MKNILYVCLFSCLICYISSCSSVKTFDIETYNPASLTFPKSVHKILMVDNAGEQPEDVAYIYTLFGNVQDTARAKTDSASYDACKSLGKIMADSPCFDDVLMYDANLRNPSDYLLSTPLSSNKIEELCQENNTDAVVSLDKLIFTTTKDVINIGDGFIYANIKVIMNGVVRSYLPGRSNPLSTILLTDSIVFGDSFPGVDIMNGYFPSTHDIIRASASIIGEKLSTNFVPYWDQERRWIYRGQDTRWKEATAYAFSDKWDNALSKWEHIYNVTKSWNQQAMAAANIALYYEMKTDLKNALEWANKSYNLFKVNKGDEYKYTKQQQIYLLVLQERVKANQQLNMQIER